MVHSNTEIFRHIAAVETVTAFLTGPERQGMNNSVSVVATEDVDGDGDLDLLLMGYNGFFQYALNNGDGTYSQAPPVYYAFGIQKLSHLDYDFDGQFEKLVSGTHVSFIP